MDQSPGPDHHVVRWSDLPTVQTPFQSAAWHDAAWKRCDALAQAVGHPDAIYLPPFHAIAVPERPDTLPGGAQHVEPVGWDVIPHIERPEAQQGTPPAVSPAPGPSPLPWHLTALGLDPSEVSWTKPVWVGMIDTSVLTTHQQFQGATLRLQHIDINGAQIPEPPNARKDHGTQMASLVVGRDVGVAPSAKLAVAASALSIGGSSVAQLLGGLVWLLSTPFSAGRYGVDLISASLDTTQVEAAQSLEWAWDYIRNVLEVPIIAAVGNDGASSGGLRVARPAGYDSVVGVGAVDYSLDAQGDRYVWIDQSWRTTAPAKPEVVAPGEIVRCAFANGFLGSVDGTSASAAIASGVGAHLLYADPTLRQQPDSFEAALRARATIHVDPSLVGAPSGDGMLYLG